MTDAHTTARSATVSAPTVAKARAQRLPIIAQASGVAWDKSSEQWTIGHGTIVRVDPDRARPYCPGPLDVWRPFSWPRSLARDGYASASPVTRTGQAACGGGASAPAR